MRYNPQTYGRSHERTRTLTWQVTREDTNPNMAGHTSGHEPKTIWSEVSAGGASGVPESRRKSRCVDTSPAEDPSSSSPTAARGQERNLLRRAISATAADLLRSGGGRAVSSPSRTCSVCTEPRMSGTAHSRS